MNIKPQIKSLLIAACGMDCGICIAYLRENNKCPDCRAANANKPKTRVKCKIKKCSVLKKDGFQYCSSCVTMPCENLERLDKRYRTKYGMSMVENLANIRRLGIQQFIKNEGLRWKCPGCGGIICVHKGRCSSCCAPVRNHTRKNT